MLRVRGGWCHEISPVVAAFGVVLACGFLHTQAMRRMALLVLLGACFEATYPPLEPGGLRYAPDSTQRAWWAAVERCSGKRVDIDRVEFVYYEADFIPNTAGMIGRSSYNPRRIETVERMRRHEGNLSHEMLHQMIHPVGGHPPEWAVRCPQVAAW